MGKKSIGKILVNKRSFLINFFNLLNISDYYEFEICCRYSNSDKIKF